MTAAPTRLETDSEGRTPPITGATPDLSWQLPEGWESQEAAELEAVVDGVALDVQHLATTVHRHQPWPWPPLGSGQAVQWRVRTTSADVVSPWSDPHWFEVGLLDADWDAGWLSPDEQPEQEAGSRPVHRLSTRFEVSSPVVRARLYATALGVYEAFIDDLRAGDEELTPGSTSFDSTLHAQRYDVTELATPGEHTLAFLLSDGWFRGLAGAYRRPARWGERTAVRAELHLEHVDGTVTVVRTGPGWTSSPSNIQRADLMRGQVSDLAAEPVPGTPAPVDLVHGPPITWSPAPPVRVIEQRAAVSVHRVGDGVWVADFGQNASGWCRLSNLGPAGARTVLDHGEHLTDGDLDLAHLDTPAFGGDPVQFEQRDEVVSNGDPDAVFEPRHTLHGFQYVRIARPGLELALGDVTMQVVHTDLRATSSFSSSSEDLNRLHEVAVWSLRGNAVDVPTDCPTRERAGWTGDWQIFVPTAGMLYDVDGFSRKWLQSVVDDQLSDGRIVNISPDADRLKAFPDPQVDMATGSAGWGDAVVIVPWALWETYGDRAVLADTWAAMERWVGFALRTAEQARHPSRVARSAEPLPHERYIWDGSFHFGEWLEPAGYEEDGTPKDQFGGDPMAWAMADKGEVGTAYLYRSTSLLARIAEVLGRSDDHVRYAEIAERVRDAWRTEFVEADGRTSAGTQASYVRALTFDLVPAALREATATHLTEMIADADGHLGTGFLSTADLLPALADAGRAELAYDLLLQRSAPSWLRMLDLGATTIWEEWDGIDVHGTAHASLNHYSKGAVIRFLYSHVLGIRQQSGSVAWERIAIEPVLDSRLHAARGTFESPQGRIAVDWRVVDGLLDLTVVVPQGTRARITLPGGEVVESGPGVVRRTTPLPIRAQDALESGNEVVR